MQGVDYAKQRYAATLKEIKRLKQSDFPYPHSRDALDEIESHLIKHLDALNKLSPQNNPLIIKTACSESLYQLFLYTPFLGIILRSTNVRNAFEVYYPFLRLAHTLLGGSAKLILSSEWEYSPYTMLSNLLKQFVLIGHPAQESGTALLLPLAGHELGHNAWNAADLYARLDAKVRKTVIALIENKHWAAFHRLFPDVKKGELEKPLFAYETWLPAHTWAMQQLEEVYCDVMGLRLFSEAYLHAFAYLLSPNSPGERCVNYPNIDDRVQFLIKASGDLALQVPTGFADLFEKEDEPIDPVRNVLVAVADDACEQHWKEVFNEMRTLANVAPAPRRDAQKVANITQRFKLVVPAGEVSEMTDVLNAGWACYHDQDLWNNVPQIKADQKLRVLNDLILKSLEVTEFHLRTR